MTSTKNKWGGQETKTNVILNTFNVDTDEQ